MGVKTGENRWNISFEEISLVYPKARELHFVNQYKLNDAVLTGLIHHIKSGNKFLKHIGESEEVWENSIEKIVFLYYDYKDTETDEMGKPIHHLMFEDPDKLDKKSIAKLKGLGWIIKHHKIGKSGYKIRIFKTN